MATLKERFEAKLSKKDSKGCIHFTGYINKNGYGEISYNSNTIKAHRASWIINNEIIPEGLCVLHKCDNPSCVNIDHLFLGTQKDNVRDMWNKNRGVKLLGEKSPSAKLTEKDVIKIRELSKIGYTHRKLGEIYGVSHNAIWKIIHKVKWKHI